MKSYPSGSIYVEIHAPRREGGGGVLLLSDSITHRNLAIVCARVSGGIITRLLRNCRATGLTGRGDIFGSVK